MPAPPKIIGKLWFTLNICGQVWEVRLAPEKQFRIKKTEKLEGVCDADRSTIFLDDKLHASKRQSVLWHELMHAVFSVTGLDRDFTEHLKHKPKWSDVEELLCSVFSIPLFDALDRNGFLMMPPLAPTPEELTMFRPWTAEESALLLRLMRANNGDVTTEVTRHFPRRSPYAVKKKGADIRQKLRAGPRPTIFEENWAAPDNKPPADVPEHWRATRAALSECEHGTIGCNGRGEKHACWISEITETRVSIPEPPKPKTPEEAGGDFIRARAQRDREQELRAANEHLLKELRDREEQILVLQELRNQKPLGPIVAPPMPSGKRRVGMPWVMFSDLHIEERVEPNKVADLNEYNLEIADKCFLEMAEAFVWLSSDQRFDCRQAGIWIGGDTFSGYIHAELAESNFLSPVQACVWLQERFERLLKYILAVTEFETIRIVCNDGNHGRLTQKMRCSTRTANSLEYLLYKAIAARFAEEPRLQFQIAEGEYNYVDVYDQTIAFMHGDSFRYMGGVGGLLIPVRRGFNEIRKYRKVDHLVLGHFHQRLDVGDIIVNGSMIGVTPYSMSNKFPPEPRQQNFFMMDSKRGKCISAPIWLPQYKG